MPALDRKVRAPLPSETRQYWFDMQQLITSILEVAVESTDIFYFGMAQYVDSPVELWHSRTWGSGIRTVSGDYAYDHRGNALFPGDVVRFSPRFVQTSTLKIKTEYGRITFVGRDFRSGSPTKGRVV